MPVYHHGMFSLGDAVNVQTCNATVPGAQMMTLPLLSDVQPEPCMNHQFSINIETLYLFACC